MSQEMYTNNLYASMVAALPKVEFEVCARHVRSIHVADTGSYAQSQKEISQIFGRILRREVGGRFPTVEYLTGHDDVIVTLLHGWVTGSCGVCVVQSNRGAGTRTPRLRFRLA